MNYDCATARTTWVTWFSIGVSSRFMTAAAAYLITILAAVQTTQRLTVIAWMERVIYNRMVRLLESNPHQDWHNDPRNEWHNNPHNDSHNDSHNESYNDPRSDSYNNSHWAMFCKAQTFKDSRSVRQAHSRSHALPDKHFQIVTLCETNVKREMTFSQINTTYEWRSALT